MAQTLPTSEVLHLAADAIERDGWTRGCAGMLAAPGLPHCLEGAIGATIGATTYPSVIKPIAGQHVYGSHDVLRYPAGRAVQEYLAERPFEWNDEPGRTAAEVIEVLRATAAIEASREDAALLAEIGRA